MIVQEQGEDRPKVGIEKQRAFRQGFMEDVWRVRREWADPSDGALNRSARRKAPTIWAGGCFLRQLEPPRGK